MPEVVDIKSAWFGQTLTGYIGNDGDSIDPTPSGNAGNDGVSIDPTPSGNAGSDGDSIDPTPSGNAGNDGGSIDLTPCVSMSARGLMNCAHIAAKRYYAQSFDYDATEKMCSLYSSRIGRYEIDNEKRVIVG